MRVPPGQVVENLIDGSSNGLGAVPHLAFGHEKVLILPTHEDVGPASSVECLARCHALETEE